MSNPGDFTFGRAELEAAVAKGVLDRNAADSLTEFLIQNRTMRRAIRMKNGCG